MSSLVSIPSPGTLAPGTKTNIVPVLSNPDRTSKITGTDETGASVTATYTVHENLKFLIGQASLVGGKAPAGTMVFWTDSTSDTLAVDTTNPLSLNLQT